MTSTVIPIVEHTSPDSLSSLLSHHRAKNLSFLASRSAPAWKSSFKDQDHFQRHSLFHLLNAKATSSQELPDWTQEATCLSVCNVEVSECTKAQILEEEEEEKPRVRMRRKRGVVGVNRMRRQVRREEGEEEHARGTRRRPDLG